MWEHAIYMLGRYATGHGGESVVLAAEVRGCVARNRRLDPSTLSCCPNALERLCRAWRFMKTTVGLTELDSSQRYQPC